MANRTFTQFFSTLHKGPVLLDCYWDVGATGAVTTDSVKGPGISSVTRLAAGVYKIKFQDNYNRFFAAYPCISAPVTGLDIAAGSLTPGAVYEITAVGTTTTAQWVTAGVPVGITPAVGVTFLCAATSAGNGTAKAVGVSGIASMEVVGDPNTTLAPQPATAQGGYVVVKFLAATDASTTTLVATDPAEGSRVSVAIYLGNSSVLTQGE